MAEVMNLCQTYLRAHLGDLSLHISHSDSQQIPAVLGGKQSQVSIDVKENLENTCSHVWNAKWHSRGGQQPGGMSV